MQRPVTLNFIVVPRFWGYDISKGVGNLVHADLCLDFVKRTKFPEPFMVDGSQLNRIEIHLDFF